MLSPLSRGYGTWTGNYDPYTDEGADSDSLPEIEEPHRHGITVGFVSRTSSATTISPQYRINSSHARARNNAGSAHRTRETTLSGRRSGLRRDQGELTSSIQASREGTDTQMTLPKTYLTKKGALVLFAAPEEETDTPTLQSGSKTRFRVCKTPVDAVDTSLKLGTMDKLVMSVLDFGEEELGNNISLKEEKEKLFLNFLNKIDQKDIDERSQPGGDVGLYLKDLKYTTSLQMGLTGDTGLPRSREALELRAILRGLQSDKWPCTYKEGLDFKQPSPLAYQYSRPPSHLNHPPRNQHQRILSSKKLEDSVQSLKSYLGRSLDSLEEVPVPLLTRRRVKRDTASAKKLYDREGTDDDLRKLWSHRPHTNTPDIHGEDEESRDKLGEISDPRLPKDDRGRIEMIEIPHPTTPRSTEIATEEKLSPHAKSESSSKLGETVNEDVGTDTLMSIAESGRKKIELPSIPDFLKPKQQTKSQQKKDQKKKGQINKGKKTISQKQQSDEKEDEITQIIKKKVTLPPENEHSVIPDFVGEALKRSQERSRQQLEEEFREKNELIGQELTKDTLFEGQEGMTAEELELAKKALKEKEEFTKEKLKEKQQKRVDDKVRKSGGSSSVKSKKSKAVPKDHLQQEKERLRQLKELEKQHRIMEIKAIEEKIAAASDTMSEEERKFRNKLQEVQMELDRIQRERVEAEQTEQDVRNVMREDRLKRMEEKARQKKEELARKRQQMLEKKQMEKQLKEEAEQRERQKIMMLMDEEERKKRQEEAKQRQEEEQREEQRRQKEEDDELARLEQEDEERRRQLEEEIEQEQMRRLLEEQDALRIQQEAIAAQKEALLEENRRKKELQALEEQRHKDELDRLQKEEMRKIAEEKARMQELQKLEEEVREKMREEMEKKKDQAIKRREVNLESKSNLNKMRHSQGITRAWVFSYFVDWPLETYFRPIGEAERKKREAKLREKRMKASVS